MTLSNIARDHRLNSRICTGCRDSEFFTRAVDGPDCGAGAVLLGVMDPDGGLAKRLTARKIYSEKILRHKVREREVQMAAPSLTEEQHRLNREIRCPYGVKKVYIRSVLTGRTSRIPTEPVLALRCAVLAATGLALEGYNIVEKDYIEEYCAGRYEECEAFIAYQRMQGKGK